MVRKKWIPCSVKQLPAELQLAAAETAARINPANKFITEALPSEVLSFLTPQHLAVLNDKYWASDKKLVVTAGFMEPTSPALRKKIVVYLNRWNATGAVNVEFVESAVDPDLRISRGRGGYYCYLGTDNASVPRNQHNMNLEGFLLSTPDSEYERVVPHEAGHYLGFPHEHTRPEIVELLDPQKTVALFYRTQGWDADAVYQQILNPMRKGSFRGTPEADITSIMCYGFPASITKNGKAIPGGARINDADYAFAASVYPVKSSPQKPGGSWYVAIFDGDGKEVFRWPTAA